MNDDAAFQRITGVSRETMDRLQIYERLLQRWNARINLISKSTEHSIWTRHMLDSAQLLKLAPVGWKSWADLGSGGGFPGAVIAMIAAEQCPNATVTLVESDQRKAAFLRAVGRETGIDMTVLVQRAETLAPLGVDVLSARALAQLPTLLGLAKRHLSSDGTALFPKGSKASSEISQALETWRFRCETHISQTDKEAVVLKIGDIERV